jgi:hypothetical protein
MAVPTLLAEEYQFVEDTGIKLNGASALPFVDILSIDGLDAAQVRTLATPREGMHGGYVDAEFEDIRTITIEGEIYASPTALETYLDSLKANFAPSKVVQPFYFGTDAGTRCIFAKSTGLRYAKDQLRRLGKVAFQVQLIAEDPRIYATTVTSQGLPGTLVLVGNRDTTGTITIAGSRTNPVITMGTSVLTFNYTLAGGNTIVIDLAKRTVILNGTTNLRSALTISGGWPVLKNGNNVFTIGGTGAGAITAAARSAWR